MRAFLLTLMFPLVLLAVVSSAAAATDPTVPSDDNEAGSSAIPDYVYAGDFSDDSQIADSARRTTFKLAGKDTITATTWYTAWNGRTLRLVASLSLIHI